MQCSETHPPLIKSITSHSNLSRTHQLLSTSPPFAIHSIQLPGNSPTVSQPPCDASFAAARLLTPALQYITSSLSLDGCATPKRSSNSSAVRKKASGLEDIGILIAPGIRPLSCSSPGSRVSIRMRDGDGDSESALTWWKFNEWEVCRWTRDLRLRSCRFYWSRWQHWILAVSVCGAECLQVV